MHKHDAHNMMMITQCAMTKTCVGKSRHSGHSLSTYCVKGPALGFSYGLIIQSSGQTHEVGFCSPFVDEDIEGQRCQVTCPRSCN